MKKYYFSLLSLVLLFTACGQGTQNFTVDSTQPLSDANRVIYQMNVGAFTAEGTFQSAQQGLDRLDTLGVDILWLMPIYPRGATMHSPYASMNFRGVNPDYGTVSKDTKGQMIHPHGWGDVFELNYQNEGLVNEMNGALKFWIDSCDVDGFRCDYVSSPTIPVSYWQNIIAELKSKSGKTVEFLSETDITNPHNIRIDSCGFDYDYAWDFQGTLAWKFKNSTSADSLKAICERFLTASAKVKNHRMVYLTNHDQNYNDGGHTLKDFYGDNRYALTVLDFAFYGMPLIYNGQEIGDPDTLNYFTDAKVKWDKVDRKMLNTIRTLIALHHQQPTLAADSAVEFLSTDNSSILAWRRGAVVSVINLAETDAQALIEGLEEGDYDQWLNSQTIAIAPACTAVSLASSEPIALEAKGYAVYVKQ